MKIKLISSETCNRCRFLKPHLEKLAQDNGYEFIEKDISLATKEEIGDAMSLPIIWFGDEQLDYDNILSKIS